MKQKNYDFVPAQPGEADFKDHGLKHGLSNHDYDLFKEEDDVVQSVVRVRRVSLPNKGENWRILKDNKVMETIEGIKLSAKEKEFLHTVLGIQFVVKYYKSGWKSLANFRTCLKSEITALEPPAKTKTLRKVKKKA